MDGVEDWGHLGALKMYQLSLKHVQGKEEQGLYLMEEGEICTVTE